MADKKRIVKINEVLNRIAFFSQIQTQELRAKLIADLEHLFSLAKMMAQTSDNREDWVKICGYIAQTINSLANSYDEVRFNEQIKELEQLIEAAKRKAGKTQAGAPIT